MRNIALKDWMWVVEIEYENHPDSELHIDSMGAENIFLAIARVHDHVKECWPYEIVSIKQVKSAQPPAVRKDDESKRVHKKT